MIWVREKTIRLHKFPKYLKRTTYYSQRTDTQHMITALIDTILFCQCELLSINRMISQTNISWKRFHSIGIQVQYEKSISQPLYWRNIHHYDDNCVLWETLQNSGLLRDHPIVTASDYGCRLCCCLSQMTSTAICWRVWETFWKSRNILGKCGYGIERIAPFNRANPIESVPYLVESR